MPDRKRRESAVRIGPVEEDPFSDPAINRQIVTDVLRLESAWLDWNAEGGEGSFDDRIVTTLVDTLDAHAKALLKAVDRDSSVPEYLKDVRRVGALLIENAARNSVLRNPYEAKWPVPSETVRPLGPETVGHPFSAAVTERARAEAEALRCEQAERWGHWRNQIVSRIEMRFEARYRHWQAEALERVRQKGTAAGDPGTAAQGIRAWEDIEIEFLSDERLQVRVGGTIETCNYGEWGFVDRRNGKPNHGWILLRHLAETGGTLKDAAALCKEWPAAEKDIQRVRQALRKRFLLDDNPLPFIPGIGYQARFKIGCARSFNT
jgi:hypothetical protein